MSAQPIAPPSEAQIWHRIIRPERDDVSRSAAEFLLRLAFDSSDLKRMHDLAVRNQDDGLTAEELSELDHYREIGLVLDLLHSKARLALRRANGNAK